MSGTCYQLIRGNDNCIDPYIMLRVILIGGSSHVGKSTLARSLGLKLGCGHISTDSLARHPGRPWRKKPKTVPEHVAEHYLSLTVDELVEDVLRHYRSMWPDIEAMITAHATDLSAERLILKGSALWPETVATLDLEEVGAIWLTGGDCLFQSRIYSESQFERIVFIKGIIDRLVVRRQGFRAGFERGCGVSCAPGVPGTVCRDGLGRIQGRGCRGTGS